MEYRVLVVAMLMAGAIGTASGQSAPPLGDVDGVLKTAHEGAKKMSSPRASGAGSQGSDQLPGTFQSQVVTSGLDCPTIQSLWAGLSNEQMAFDVACESHVKHRHVVSTALWMLDRYTLSDAVSFGSNEFDCAAGNGANCASPKDIERTRMTRYAVRVRLSVGPDTLVKRTIKVDPYKSICPFQYDVSINPAENELNRLNFGSSVSVTAECGVGALAATGREVSDGTVTVSAIYGSSVRQECGTSGSTDARIEDCASLVNGSRSYNLAGFPLTLVSRQRDSAGGYREILQDPKTGLLWTELGSPYKYKDAKQACAPTDEKQASVAKQAEGGIQDKSWGLPTSEEFQTVLKDGLKSGYLNWDVEDLWVKEGRVDGCHREDSEDYSIDCSNKEKKGVICVGR